MSTLRRILSGENKLSNRLDRLLGHWLLAAAMILVAAALTIPQLDKYPLSLDSLFNFAFSYGLTENSYTIADVLENLFETHPDQSPLYYALLNPWGRLAGHSLAAARLVSLLCGLLALAMVYRLTRDFVSAMAGVFAVFMLLCNAFFAFYYVQVRYYTLVVLLAALIVWLYLRIVTRRQQPKRRDYLALLLACYALISIHAFGFLLYLVLALYHLLAVRKDTRWLLIVVVATASVLLAAPQLYMLLTAGVEYALSHHGSRSASVSAVLATWIIVISNGNPLLSGISLVGAGLGWRSRALRGNPVLLLFPLLVVSIGVASVATGIVSEGQMRYLLVGMPIVVGFIAAGLFALYRLRRWLGLLALVWLVAGMAFMRAADWEHLIQGRTWAYTHPPWHLISRWIQQSGEKLPVMTIGVSHKILRKYTFQPDHMMTYYFGQHDISLYKTSALDIDRHIGGNALEQPGYWILFQRGGTEPSDLDMVAATLDKYGYMNCGTQKFSNNTQIFIYRWKSLQCDTQPNATYFAEAGAYLHYGAHHDETKLLFTGAWQEGADADPGAQSISFQLIDPDWGSHAQIDLPTASMNEMRQLIFELADVPAGDYRLMVVVYDAQTGERHAWQDNEGWVPEMQQLAEIAIPE